jgi:hypothetical protein
MRFRYLSAVQALIVVLPIACTLLATWSWGARHQYVPCISDCGETFIAQLYARNYRFFGLDFGLVEDHATSPTREAHPYHYTHNVNIGGLSYAALEAVGVGSLVAKQFFVLLIFGAGLLYTYLAISALTRSRLAAFCGLTTACLDFGFFISFGLHALRAWTWLALFGLLLHVGKFTTAPDSTRRKVHGAAILVFVTLSFGIGYEFWVVAMCIAVATHLCFSFQRDRRWLDLRSLASLLALMFIPFVLRQIHIATVLGFEYWSRDFYYTFVTKVPFASRIFSLPGSTDIERFYGTYNVMRPPTAPIASVGDFKSSLVQWGDAMVNVVIPLAGSVTICLVAILCITAFVYCMRQKRFMNRRSTSDVRANAQSSRVQVLSFDGAARMLLGLTIGMGVGCLLMLKMVVPFYFALAMPLFGAVTTVVKGIALALLIDKIRLTRHRPLARGLAALCVILVLVDHALVQAANIREVRLMDTTWIREVSERPNATYAVSFIAPAVAGFTSNWAIGIRPGREHEMLADIVEGRPPFRREDLFWFGERDAGETAVRYLRPDYWLYFSMDDRTLYSAVPRCRKDYLYRALGSLRRRLATQSPITSVSIESISSRPSKAIVDVKVKPYLEIEELYVSFDGENYTPGSVNCITNVTSVEMELTPDVATRLHHIHLRIVLTGVKEAVTARVPISRQLVARGRSLPKPQPAVRDIVARYPGLPLEVWRGGERRWDGYALIDLRAINQ